MSFFYVGEIKEKKEKGGKSLAVLNRQIKDAIQLTEVDNKGWESTGEKKITIREALPLYTHTIKRRIDTFFRGKISYIPEGDRPPNNLSSKTVTPFQTKPQKMKKILLEIKQFQETSDFKFF